MSKIRERLLKRKDEVAKAEVTIKDIGKIEVHSVTAERLEELRTYSRIDGKLDPKRLQAHTIAETVHVDGAKLFDVEFRAEAGDGMTDDLTLVNSIFKPGEQERILEVFGDLMGYGDPEEEVETLKN